MLAPEYIRYNDLLSIVRSAYGDVYKRQPPCDEDALVDSLRLLIEQPALRVELRRRGLAHAARFSWQRCAEETVAVYDRVLGMTDDA